MKVIIKIILVILTLSLFIISSCTNQQSENKNSRTKTISLFKKIKTVEIDSIMKMHTIWRTSKALLMRYYSKNDSSSLGSQILLYRNNNGELVFKSQKRWVTVDSLDSYLSEYETDISSGKIIYCYKFMEKHRIYEISNNNIVGIYFTMNDNLEFLYKQNEDWIPPNWENIEGNWWIIEK